MTAQNKPGWSIQWFLRRRCLNYFNTQSSMADKAPDFHTNERPSALLHVWENFTAKFHVDRLKSLAFSFPKIGLLIMTRILCSCTVDAENNVYFALGLTRSKSGLKVSGGGALHAIHSMLTFHFRTTVNTFLSQRLTLSSSITFGRRISDLTLYSIAKIGSAVT